MKKWKDDVVHQSVATTHTKKPPAPAVEPSASVSSTTSKASSQTSSPTTPVNEVVARTVKTDEVSFKSTGSVPRNKTIELMYASIGYNSGAGKLLFSMILSIKKKKNSHSICRL